MNLTEMTNIIKQREKSIQLTFWDIGSDLLKIKNYKLYTPEYDTMDDYMKDNFTFSPQQGWKFMKLVDEIKDRTRVERVGFEKMYLLLQIPEQQRDEIIEEVEEAGMSRKQLAVRVKRLKSTAGTPPHYEHNQTEAIRKLIRQFVELSIQFKSYIEIKTDLTTGFANWIVSAKKQDSVELTKLYKEAETMLKKI